MASAKVTALSQFYLFFGEQTPAQLRTVAIAPGWVAALSALIYHCVGKSKDIRPSIVAGHIKIHALSINHGEIEIKGDSQSTYARDISHSAVLALQTWTLPRLAYVTRSVSSRLASLSGHSHPSCEAWAKLSCNRLACASDVSFDFTKA